MIQVVFALRFQSQLHRTRPKLLRDLEKSIIETLEGYGSKVRVENKLINGVFSQETLGFWLDMLCVLETIKNILERTATELYGHVCIVGENLPEEDVLFLVRALPTEPWGTGIWCTPGICDALKPFIDFDEALSGDNQPGSGFSQLRAIREWGDTPVLTGEKNHTGKIKGFLKRKPACNTIVVGDEWASYQEELILYCKEHMKGIPPLIIRLKKGKNSITCLIDALTPEIKTLLEMEDQLDPETRNRLAELEKTLFKERLRDELSEFTIKQGELFFTLLLGLYRTAVEKKSAKPVIILENLQDADPGSRAIIAGSYFAYPAKERITIYGTSASLKALKPWEELFSRIIKFTSEEAVQEPEIKIDLPRDLWEIWYCSVLFKRFFPPFLIPQLLQEEGKNPVMIEKSLEILSRLHIPKQGNFINQAETALGKEAVSVRSVVHRRLLAWVKDFRLKPCFPLLVALADLGSLEDDNLILDTICADIVNGTFSGIERAIQTKTFSAVTGKDKENALLLIVKTQKALTHGGNEEIKNAFSDFSLAEKSGSPCIRSGIAANIASFNLSTGDAHAAEESIKEAMLITQNENAGRGLARIYRLFSLVQLTNNLFSEAIDYFSFAVENAHKSNDTAELGISSYYAAVAHFIFGNISKALSLAEEARTASLDAVLPGWADRSRFLKGRLYFETGLYEKALDIFEELKSGPYGSITEDFTNTVNAWIYRSGVFIDHKARTETVKLAGFDAKLFRAEAAFIEGKYKKVLELINKVDNSEMDEDMILIEQSDWRSGFYQCELLLFPLHNLKNRMINTLRVLSHCYLNKEEDRTEVTGGEPADFQSGIAKAHPTGYTGGSEEAIREMQWIMRDDLPEKDPNGSFYLYSYYQLLKQTGAQEVDMNTAISIAFKRLQKRASRIEDADIKRSFLSTHYWNSALTAAAKEHKLM